MKYKCLTVGDFGANCYIAYKNKTAIIVDPGADEILIEKAVKELELDVRAILLTHGHFDHVGATSYLSQKFGAKVYMSEKDAFMVTDSSKNLNRAFGLSPFLSFTPDFYVKDGDELIFDEIKIKVFETPGHTKGSLSFLSGNIIFSGDTLFNESIGRCDFPGGDINEMFDSLSRVYADLPDETLLLAGHNNESTIGYEKSFNPYLSQIN